MMNLSIAGMLLFYIFMDILDTFGMIWIVLRDNLDNYIQSKE
jgi:hypothetical protein